MTIPWHMDNTEFFAGLPGEKEEFLRVAERMEPHKHEMIFFEEDAGDACYYIQAGLVKIFKLSAGGKESLFFLRKRNEMFGLAEIIEARSRKANAQALTDCTLYKMNKHAFEKFLDARPLVTKRVVQVLGRRLRYLGEQIEGLMSSDVRGRLIKLLVHLAHEKLPNERSWTLPVKIPVKLTQEQMASMTGSCQQTISKLLGDLQEEGHISVCHRELTIVNPLLLLHEVER